MVSVVEKRDTVIGLVYVVELTVGVLPSVV